MSEQVPTKDQLREVESRWRFDLYNQWAAFRNPQRMNWIDFTFVDLGVEWSPYKESCEVTFMLLGLGGCLTYYWGPFATEEDWP